MDERTLHQQLERKELRNAYLLLGTDATRIERSLEAVVAAATSPETRDWDVAGFDGEECSAREILEALQTVPFLGGRRVVYVRRFDKMAADEAERIAAWVASAKGDAVLILIAEALDQRRKAVKQLYEHAAVVQFEDPKSGDGLLDWLLREAPRFGVKLQGKTARLLIDVAGEQPESLRRELEKLAAYLGSGGVPTEEDILAVAAAGNPEAAQNAIFQLCDAVAEGRTAQALLKLDELLASGANAIYIVYMLARHFRYLHAVMTCGERQAARIAQVLNLKPNQRFMVERLLRQASRVDVSQVEATLEQLLEADLRLKRSAPPRPTLESLIVRLTQSVPAVSAGTRG